MAADLPTVDELVNGLNDLPALPAVVADLIASIEDENIDLERLANKIERDPGLASKTLRVANSPFFGLAGKIGSIQEATTIVGLSTIRSLALASAVSNVAGQASRGRIDLHAFWLHAFETAIAARQLAILAGVPPDAAFIAGLLHDIGKIAIGVLHPTLLKTIEVHCAEQHCGWHAAEIALGLPTHGEVGGALARRWHFPETLCVAIAEHHPPLNHDSRLAQDIHVADVLAQTYAAATDRGTRLDTLDATAWDNMGVTDAALVAAARGMRKATDIAAQIA